ncbi:hypothetical protein GCG21_13680 [Pseudactinotalea sp. HY160]|uniref:hypothetical protein n=1 Tax=Pseudactinotalea sp. HY160 TaxID=2654490 RepID=UPI00128D0482|nr:hypothetical protein [Pseudactinotalea sp. HY160]MPV51037.1 hypothetical protein [Pseudactinotalea sp. HY160]
MTVDSTKSGRSPGNHSQKGWLARTGHKAAAMFGVAALLGAGTVGMISGPASAKDAWTGQTTGWDRGAGEVTGGGNYFGNFQDSAGHRAVCGVDGYTLGPGPGNRPTTYSAPSVITSFTPESMRNADGTRGFTGSPVTGDTLAEIAYIMSEFADTGDKVEAAASELAIYRHSGVEQAWTTSIVAGASARADEMISAAQSKAGPYTVPKPSVNLASDGRTGLVTGIGAKSDRSGDWLAGYDFTASISGPATWDDNGSQSLTGTTTGSGASFGITSTGNGPVKVKVTVSGLPSSQVFEMTPLDGPEGQSQRLFAAGITQDLQNEGDPFDMAFDFQPTITTEVSNRYISAGDSFDDNVTAGVDGDPWVEGVSVLAEGTLYGPFSTPQAESAQAPADAPVAGTDELTFDGPGTQTAGGDITASASGYYTWVWTIDKDSQSAVTQKFIRDSFTDGFGIAAESMIVRATPTITTERESEIIDTPGDVTLRDTVTLSLADGQDWPVDFDGSSAVIEATGEVYYSTTPFAQAAAGEAVPGENVGTADLTFTEAGDQVAEAALNNGGKPGFYTWVWTIDQSNLFDGYTTPSWELVETTTVRHIDLTHESMTREYNVVPGGRAFDSITIGGVPGYHGDYTGDVDGWEADNTTANVTLYGPLDEAPATAEVPADAPAFWTKDVPFENGRFQVGYDEDDPIVLDDEGYYVFVYSYDGDARIAPFSSDFNDVLERVYVPGTPTPELPAEVITRATPSVPVGTPFNDEAHVSGNVPEGATLTFDLFKGPFELDEAGKCVVPAEEDAELVASFEAIEVDGPGVYASEEYISDEAACFFWVETLYGPDGDEIHKGKFGQPGETTKVYEPEREIGVVTQLGHDGDQESGPVVGDNIWDEVTIEGDIKEGDYTIVDLFTWEDGESPVCTSPVWSSDKIELVEGTTVYETGEFTTEDAKVHGFVETTYDRDGNILSKGECGEPDETITVTNGGGGDTGAGVGDQGEEMQVTGAQVGIGAGIAVLLAAAGVALRLVGRRRETPSQI